MKKKSFTANLVILLSVLSAFFLFLAIISSVWSVKDTIKAIDAIEMVEYNEAVRAQIDSAYEKYESLDKNLNLQSGVTNSERLTSAKVEYARLAIKEVYLAMENKEADEVVLSLIREAQDIMEAYFSADEYDLVSNYADLEAAIESVAALNSEGADNLPEESGGSEEEIEIC